MRIYHSAVLVLCGLILFACKNTPSTTLTYNEIRASIFEQSNGEGIEWHGEALDESAKSDLVMTESTACGQGDCGKLVVISNKSDQSIEIIIKSNFSLPDFPPYMATRLIAAPHSTVNVGCTKLCVEKQTIAFSHQIVGAKYVNQ